MGRRQKKASPFPKILGTMMDESGLTIRAAAKIADVPVSTLANWRAGSNPDDHFAVKRLADHFGVSLSFLPTGQQDKAGGGSDPRGGAVYPSGEILFDGYAKITIEKLLRLDGAERRGERRR